MRTVGLTPTLRSLQLPHHPGRVPAAPWSWVPSPSVSPPPGAARGPMPRPPRAGCPVALSRTFRKCPPLWCGFLGAPPPCQTGKRGRPPTQTPAGPGSSLLKTPGASTGPRGGWPGRGWRAAGPVPGTAPRRRQEARRRVEASCRRAGCCLSRQPPLRGRGQSCQRHPARSGTRRTCPSQALVPSRPRGAPHLREAPPSWKVARSPALHLLLQGGRKLLQPVGAWSVD